MAAAGVSLTTLVDPLRRAVSPPGSDLFPDATDDDYVGYLEDAFWDARVDGLLPDWTILAVDNDQLVFPQDASSDVDITRDLLSILLLWAAINIVTNELKNSNSVFKAQAGPVSFEQQQSSQLLRDILQELKDRRAIIMRRLSDLGIIKDVYIDAVQSRNDSLDFLDTWWTR